MLDPAVGAPLVEPLSLPGAETADRVVVLVGRVHGDHGLRERPHGLRQTGQAVEGEAGGEHPAGGGDPGTPSARSGSVPRRRSLADNGRWVRTGSVIPVVSGPQHRWRVTSSLCPPSTGAPLT